MGLLQPTRLAVAATGLLLLTTAAATAAPPSPALVPVFTFPASHGYRALGWAVGPHAGEPAQLLLIVGRNHASVTYLAPAEVGEAGDVHADLGALGEVDLHFAASGRVAHAKSACGGRDLIYEAGEYRGTIDFKGEEGYTQAVTDHARLLPRFFNVLCPGRGYGWTTPGPGAQLVARNRPLRGTFKALAKTPRSRSYFSARIDERRGRIHVSRQVSTSGPAADFLFLARGQRAHASPPAPFSGSAVLSRGRWRGTLSVDFPGHSNVRLAGPGFRGSLLHGRFSGSAARGIE
jgi:hypothetical protein